MKTYNLAILSSLASSVLLLLAGLTSALAITVPSLIFGFILVPFYIIMLACIYSKTRKYTIFGLIALVFASMYGVLVGFNYFLQLGFIGRGIPIPESLSMSNPDSIFLIIELLGYFFMGISTLVLIPLFKSSLMEKVLKFLFFLNFLLGIGGIIGYALQWNMNILLVGLIVWNIIMPIAAFLLYLYFKKHKDSSLSNI